MAGTKKPVRCESCVIGKVVGKEKLCLECTMRMYSACLEIAGPDTRMPSEADLRAYLIIEGASDGE